MNPDNLKETKNPGKELDSANRTSQSLIAGVKGNDPDAWERMVKLYSPLVYFWCQESGLSRTDLSDIFQDVFHSLTRNINKFRPKKNGSFRGWLRTMTRNKVNDHFRMAGRMAKPAGGTDALRYLEQFPAEEPAKANGLASGTADAIDVTGIDAPNGREAELEQSMLQQALGNIRCHFADKTWQAFQMVVIDGRETNDVAADLKMRPGSVRVAKFRVLKRLRLEIGDEIQ